MDKAETTQAVDFNDLDVWYISPIKYLAEIIEMEAPSDNEKISIFAMQIQKIAQEMAERLERTEIKESTEIAA